MQSLLWRGHVLTLPCPAPQPHGWHGLCSQAHTGWTRWMLVEQRGFAGSHRVDTMDAGGAEGLCRLTQGGHDGCWWSRGALQAHTGWTRWMLVEQRGFAGSHRVDTMDAGGAEGLCRLTQGGHDGCWWSRGALQAHTGWTRWMLVEQRGFAGSHRVDTMDAGGAEGLCRLTQGGHDGCWWSRGALQAHTGWTRWMLVEQRGFAGSHRVDTMDAGGAEGLCRLTQGGHDGCWWSRGALQAHTGWTRWMLVEQRGFAGSPVPVWAQGAAPCAPGAQPHLQSRWVRRTGSGRGAGMPEKKESPPHTSRPGLSLWP
ncbi:PREDICTED: uncharacterized protein LOC107603877 [Ficedula albicollis]|uniref:uncharacterized protein LOC107603877 n=1 Tax=Ficedula albicollis TaxID=59894 RepID=UPI0007AD8F9F|nr:PREDICTED: uncharacterized protein LOC107603877 [Ficedula albicollis]